MEAAFLTAPQTPDQRDLVAAERAAKVVAPGEFHTLIVSHRRMVRADQAAARLKGLRDLDTGELFVVHESHLLDS